jgi:DMSO/TMAO reductase YedYZ molybdopterin-dependent catalytic subunit
LSERYRLPPGQHLTTSFPVLHYGSVPRVDPASWRFRLFGDVEEPLELSLDDLKALPVTELVTDIHCVTTWSKYDTRWRGVRFREVHGHVKLRPGVTYGLSHGEQGYSTGLPLEAWLDDDVLIAWEFDGEPLTAEHGGPVRMLVPKRYFYKSAKWANGMEYLTGPRLGFWERNGYSEGADPWREERYE